jgi:hypothetical protein
MARVRKKTDLDAIAVDLDPLDEGQQDHASAQRRQFGPGGCKLAGSSNKPMLDGRISNRLFDHLQDAGRLTQ